MLSIGGTHYLDGRRRDTKKSSEAAIKIMGGPCGKRGQRATTLRGSDLKCKVCLPH